MTPKPCVLLNLTAAKVIHDHSIYLFTGKVSSMAQSLFILPNPDPEPLFVPLFINDAMKNATAAILEACGNDKQCIYDSVQTGSIEVGLATNSIQQNNTMEAELLS